jgi:Rad3-related DNA helicase
MGLLGGTETDYEVYAKSVFDVNKRELLIAEDVTSKYTRRSEQEFYSIAKYIFEIVTKRHGNYMVFCPSYQFLRQVYEVFEENFATEEMECVVQGEYMTEEEREKFLNKFEGNFQYDLNENIQMEIEMEEDTYLIGFCVLGGIFSEGIDLKEDSLIGAIIVGTGLPQVCYEREILKGYFDVQGKNGFDYAYRFPGMNKVLQAAGRVIRTDSDIGIIALLDERFLQNTYTRLFPREWSEYNIVRENTVGKQVEKFWDEWL